MNRILKIAIAVPVLALMAMGQSAQAGHNCGYGGGYYGGGYGYVAPVYSYAPVYRTAYVQPSYGISIGVGQGYYGVSQGYYGGGYGGYRGGYGGYRGGYGGYHGGYHGGHHHHR